MWDASMDFEAFKNGATGSPFGPKNLSYWAGVDAEANHRRAMEEAYSSRANAQGHNNYSGNNGAISGKALAMWISIIVIPICLIARNSIYEAVLPYNARLWLETGCIPFDGNRVFWARLYNPGEGTYLTWDGRGNNNNGDMKPADRARNSYFSYVNGYPFKVSAGCPGGWVQVNGSEFVRGSNLIWTTSENHPDLTSVHEFMRQPAEIIPPNESLSRNPLVVRNWCAYWLATKRIKDFRACMVSHSARPTNRRYFR